jgi:hypothetical protein
VWQKFGGNNADDIRSFCGGGGNLFNIDIGTHNNFMVRQFCLKQTCGAFMQRNRPLP